MNNFEIIECSIQYSNSLEKYAAREKLFITITLEKILFNNSYTRILNLFQ